MTEVKRTPGIWVNHDKDELLDLLKEEIIRIGIQDRPSRTEYQRLYDNTRTPSPNTYRNIFQKSWMELMKTIGLEYDGQKEFEESKKISKRNAVMWADMTTESVLELVVRDVKKKKIKGVAEYIQRRDRKTTPSYQTLNKMVPNGWKSVTDYYREKFGEDIGLR